MAKVKITSSVNVEYRFNDNNSGAVVSGSTDYALLCGLGKPQVVKVTKPIQYSIEVEREQLIYDYKQRLVTDNF